MASQTPTMTDPRRSISDEDIIGILKSRLQPVWTSTAVADELDVTRQTANSRLKRLEKESDEVESITVGQATAYYIPGVTPLPSGGSIKERHKKSIIQWATDRFVGDEHEPWTAVKPQEGTATEGDTIQIVVEGTPESGWRQSRIYGTVPGDESRDELLPGEILKEETQALVSGELYEKPTVPIEHINYPDDYDLESKLKTEWYGDPPNQPLVALGLKRHWLNAVNDAVFMTNVTVDWISPKGEGEEAEADAESGDEWDEITDDELENLMDGVEEWREENVEDENDISERDGEPGL